jgi:hypothetical protein
LLKYRLSAATSAADARVEVAVVVRPVAARAPPAAWALDQRFMAPPHLAAEDINN